MSQELTVAEIEAFLTRQYAADDPVRQAMEAYARERSFPIVGPLVGRHLYQLARMIGARRVFELGSGFGYSALFFCRAVGPQGTVHCTDLSAENIRLAEKFLTQAGLWERVVYHLEDALAALERTGGEWDIIYNDVSKSLYPQTIEPAYRHLRPGGLFITDNIFWGGRPLRGDNSPSTAGVVEFTRRLFEHQGFLTTVLPIRDGVAVALKL
ncbi:MAG: O-methyltransferase [Chloroflexi bacterium]|nr:MAG: O-methyltransferase [Chloroflexota bacterium]